MKRLLAASAATLALVTPLLLVPPAAADRYAPGSTGGGDPYFPAAGNGGYDVQHYALDLRYAPGTGRLDGTAVITLLATSDLDRFSLDLRGLTASSVLVDGKRAAFSQVPPDEETGLGGELVVTPRPKLKSGTTHAVTVVYGGVPGQPLDLGGSFYGFVSFPDGSLVANQPDGASTWYPVNDVPTDKATYDFRITVPEGKTAVANGELVGLPVTRAGMTTFTWRATDPMASYLSTASIGDYDLLQSTGPGGLPILDFVEQGLTPARRTTTLRSLALQPAMIEYFSTLLGPYPFTSFGSIVDDDTVFYALETQTRPVYSRVASEGTVAHELAHQWLGNSVTLSTWDDIWLNEGSATYFAWLWGQRQGRLTAQQQYQGVMDRPADDPFWQVLPGDPGAADLFAGAVYDRGAAFLHRLRLEVGETAFSTLLRRWATENRNSNVTTADFEALAEQVSGKELTPLFQTWLYTAGRPAA